MGEGCPKEFRFNWSDVQSLGSQLKVKEFITFIENFILNGYTKVKRVSRKSIRNFNGGIMSI